ncbi:MAG TPA: L,D-transpeptidase family protein [Blastocatellia bacterium]|nr:L,D-transpeptidase family protein [Blastocatellia bacterium]
MRGTTSIEYHPDHGWLLAVLRFLLALLIILVLAYFTESHAQKQSSTRHLTTADVVEAEQLLSDLGYWTGPVDGVLDGATRHGLTAFQKVEGRKRSGRLTVAELEALRVASPPEARDKTYAHLEVDLERQILMVVDETGRASRILPVCTGNEKMYVDQGRRQRAHTPRGRFTVTRKINGLRISTLGSLYYPCYIVNGIAIHGSASISPYPASHGCIRIPMFAAREFHDITPVGTVVLVYDDSE